MCEKSQFPPANSLGLCPRDLFWWEVVYSVCVYIYIYLSLFIYIVIYIYIIIDSILVDGHGWSITLSQNPAQSMVESFSRVHRAAAQTGGPAAQTCKSQREDGIKRHIVCTTHDVPGYNPLASPLDPQLHSDSTAPSPEVSSRSS